MVQQTSRSCCRSKCWLDRACIGMQKLTRKDNELVVSEFRPLEIYTVLVLEYLALILIVSFAVRKIEQRMQWVPKRHAG